MHSMKEREKVLLIVRDGWGFSSKEEFNYIWQAKTPFTDFVEKEYPTVLLNASGREVGLPDGYFGNSEVGHMTLGAGRVLKQSLLRINDAIEDGTFFRNKELLSALDFVQEKKSKVHLFGLLQKEGVHAHFKHLVALIFFFKEKGLSKDDLFIHIVTDGRDAEEQHAIYYLRELKDIIGDFGTIVTMGGRYFAMDRNNNWDRIEKHYQALMGESCVKSDVFDNEEEYLLSFYKNKEFSDEFLPPAYKRGFRGIKKDDLFINYSFRKDRERQITHVFLDENFSYFSRCGERPYYLAMTEYFEGIPHVLFRDLKVDSVLGEEIEKNGLSQLRISETEKYAHVTFFFDGGEERNFRNEEKIIIPSPNVSTYDLKPEMSSKEITNRLLKELEKGYDFILCNFPNADMVGHTGNGEAIKKAIEAVDYSLSKIIPKALDQGYAIFLTADHGNAEYKYDDFSTSHTLNPVPLSFISRKNLNVSLQKGLGLKNIASSVCEILHIQKPDIYEKSIFMY